MWQHDLQDLGNYFESSLRTDLKRSPQSTAIKEKKKSSKNLRFKTQEAAASHPNHNNETIREEFNFKLQGLMEEVQNTVTLKEFEKKCSYFEERIGLIKGMIPSSPASAPVAQVADSKYHEPVVEFDTLSARMKVLEGALKQVKITIDNIFSLVEKQKSATGQEDQHLQLADDITPIVHKSQEGFFAKTRPKPNQKEAHKFLNLEEIENFDIFEGQSSQRSFEEKLTNTLKPIQSKPSKKKPNKQSSSTSKIAFVNNREKPLSQSQLNPLSTAFEKGQVIQAREEFDFPKAVPKTSKKSKPHAEKIRSLLGKSAANPKK